MKRIELIATSKDVNCTQNDLHSLLDESIAEMDGAHIESTFTTKDRAGELEIAVGYLIGIASGLTVELIREIIQEKSNARKLEVEVDVTELDEKSDETIDESK